MNTASDDEIQDTLEKLRKYNEYTIKSGLESLDRLMTTATLLNSGGIVLILPVLFEFIDSRWSAMLLVPVTCFFAGLVMVARHHWLKARRGVLMTKELRRLAGMVSAGLLPPADVSNQVEKSMEASPARIGDHFFTWPFILFGVGAGGVGVFIALMLI